MRLSLSFEMVVRRAEGMVKMRALVGGLESAIVEGQSGEW